MKKYIVRLVDYKGSVLDGEVFEAENAPCAFNKYLTRYKRLGIEKCVYDRYTIDEWLFD